MRQLHPHQDELHHRFGKVHSALICSVFPFPPSHFPSVDLSLMLALLLLIFSIALSSYHLLYLLYFNEKAVDE
jgi:hypothetical protein